MISAIKLSKTFPGPNGELAVLQDLSFSIEAGSQVGLVGRSGSGKTTLLNLLAGLDQANSGRLLIGEQDLVQATASELDHYRRTQVGIVFQQFRLIPHQTALQNVELPMRFRGVPRRQRIEIANECLQLVGLEDRSKHYPKQLSGGEQQRVAVARAITGEPKILLADEPTGNLDSTTASQIVEVLAKVSEHLKSILFVVTHDEALAQRFPQLFRITDGKLRNGACDENAEKGSLA